MLQSLIVPFLGHQVVPIVLVQIVVVNDVPFVGKSLPSQSGNCL